MKWVWIAWLLLAVVGGFALLEGFALTHDAVTLSEFVWDISAAWPPFPFAIGLVVGFLTCHFWWGGVTSFGRRK